MFLIAAHIEIVSPKRCGGPDGGPLAKAMPAIFFIRPAPYLRAARRLPQHTKEPCSPTQKWVDVTASIQGRCANSAGSLPVNGSVPSSISDPWGSRLLRSLGMFLSPMVGRRLGTDAGFSELTRSVKPSATLSKTRDATRETWTNVIGLILLAPFNVGKRIKQHAQRKSAYGARNEYR